VIGKLEELTLLAVMRAGEAALASEVYANVLKGHQTAAFGAVYTTLTRLAKKGLVEEVATTDDKRRQRRGFSISAGGRSALAEALEASASVGGWGKGGVYGLAS